MGTSGVGKGVEATGEDASPVASPPSYGVIIRRC